MNSTGLLLLTMTLLSAAGCATIAAGTTQSIMVDTFNAQGATCKGVDKRGREYYWANTPSSTTVQKGDGPMTITCEKKGFKKTVHTIDETVTGATFGNIVAGGVVGFLVDATSGAAQEYPTMVKFPLQPEDPSEVKETDEQESSPAVSTTEPALPTQRPEPIRRVARLTHVKGKPVSIPPMVLQAEYNDSGEGRGTSRIIFPGNRIVEGDFQLLPLDQSFKGVVAAQLIDPDPRITSTNADRKGFARYSASDGTVLECAFLVLYTERIEKGLCVDNRGNEYRVTD